MRGGEIRRETGSPPDVVGGRLNLEQIYAKCTLLSVLSRHELIQLKQKGRQGVVLQCLHGVEMRDG